MLIEQYNAYSPLKGYHVDGALTLGENMADDSGLAIAHQAYRLSRHGQPAPAIAGLSADQRFYMGWAQVWRNNIRDETRVVYLKIDPHAPGEFRTNGTLRNQAGFYDAFGVQPGDGMYLPPERRVRVW